MAAVEITISGILYDKLERTQQHVVLIGDASLTGLGVGGGPIIPPSEGEKPPRPPYYPAHPITGLPVDPGYGVPEGGHIWGPPGPWPSPPIYLPPQIPPGAKPPTTPPPGTVTPVPPPEGSGGWPVQPVVTPEYVVFNYPGYGPVYVTPPATAQPKPAAPATGSRGA